MRCLQFPSNFSPDTPYTDRAIVEYNRQREEQFLAPITIDTASTEELSKLYQRAAELKMEAQR